MADPNPYTIESKEGMHTVMYNEFPIAIFKNVIDAEQYRYYLFSGKMTSVEAFGKAQAQK